MEEKEFLEDGVTPNPKFVKKEDNNGGGDKGTPKTFTQADLDRIAGETRAEERKKADAAVEKAKADTKAETERLAALNSEEREKELRAKQEKDLADQRRELTIRENKLDGINKLNELKLPIEFIDDFVHEDKDAMFKRIDVFNAKFNEKVAEAVKVKMAGGKGLDDPKGDGRGGLQVPSSTF